MLASASRKLTNAKSIGWAIYVAGFAIWLFGYLCVREHDPNLLARRRGSANNAGCYDFSSVAFSAGGDDGGRRSPELRRGTETRTS
jgi:hypothetical protein